MFQIKSGFQKVLCTSKVKI